MATSRTTAGTQSPTLRLIALAACAALAACGGDKTGVSAHTGYSAYAEKCASPRSGTDPLSGNPYPDKPGTATDEKRWIQGWLEDLYLWYRELPTIDPAAAAYPTPTGYFDVMKTPAVTASGKPKDQFHFWSPTADWERLAQSGVDVGYGIQWVAISARPPREFVVAYVEPGSPAAAATVGRGAHLAAVDGVDLVNGTDTTTLNAGLFPATAGETHTLSILDLNATTPRNVPLTSVAVTHAPVQNVGSITTTSGTVGYMLFNDQLGLAEAALVAAVNQLEAANVTDLMLDIRYNGGGYINVASELAYMIAGPARTSGKAFERTVFNDRYPTTDPVTGQPLVPYPFYASAYGFTTVPRGQALPHLDLPRVFVLTGGGTCSASESVINGLRGVDVEVVQVGFPTCGKPYGFYPQDNCGTTYFAIQMQGVNAKGFGDYADGFVPGGNADPALGDAGLPGCQVTDDFGHALGDPAEARRAAALGYRESQTCPPATFPLTLRGGAQPVPSADGELLRSPLREIRILPR